MAKKKKYKQKKAKYVNFGETNIPFFRERINKICIFYKEF
jgi:hypothetical protein